MVSCHNSDKLEDIIHTTYACIFFIYETCGGNNIENVDFLISNRTNSQHGKIDISNKVEKICMVF